MQHFHSLPDAEKGVCARAGTPQPQLCVLWPQGWTRKSCWVSSAHVAAMLFTAWHWPLLKQTYQLGGQQA